VPAVIGPIVRLQVQRGPVKVGDKGARRYLTEPILPFERVQLEPEGVVGLRGDETVLDAHHRRHPLRKNEDGAHGISVGFTSHYAAMQARFGTHLTLGCAGENLIVEADRRIYPEDVAAGLLVLDPLGHLKGRLTHVIVAPPCKPFTGFALGYRPVAAEVLKASLQFLDGGTRGFYCTWSGENGPAIVTLGDLVALAD
jgi:hypothetical protein